MISNQLFSKIFNRGTLTGLVFFMLVVFTSYDDIYQRTISPVFACVLIMLIVVTLLIFRFNTRSCITRTDVILAFIFMFSIIRLSFEFPTNYSFYNLRYVIFGAGGYVLGRCLDGTRERDSFFAILFMVATFEGMLAFIQIDYSELLLNGLQSDNILNVKGDFSNSSMLALLMSTGILIGLYYARKSKSKVFKIGCSISLLVLIFILAVTTSRAAILIITLGIPIVFKVRIKLLIPIVVIVLGLFFTYKRDSLEGRLLIWKIATTIITENPITGIGPNRFGAVYNKYQGIYFKNGEGDNKEEWLAANNFLSFNLPIKLIIEYGFLGLICFYAVLYLILRNSRGHLLITSLIIGYNLFAMFSYPLDQIETSFLFFAVLGTGTSLNIRPSFKLLINLTKCLKFVFIVMIFSASFYEVLILRSLIEWRSKKNLVIESPEKYINLLYTLNATLSGFPEFLFHRGAVFVARGNEKDALEIFTLCKDRLPSSDLYIYLGLCYEADKENGKALEHYEFATKITPSFIIPKYYLFLYYKNQGNDDMAKQTAKTILTQETKKFNLKLTRIKNEMKIFVGNK